MAYEIEIKRTECGFDAIVEFMQNIGFLIVINNDELGTAIVRNIHNGMYTYILGTNEYVEYPVDKNGLVYYPTADDALREWSCISK